MNTKINPHFLKEITRHYRSQGLYYAIKSLNYERCAELPYVLQCLEPRFGERLNFLDIGPGGESPLPTYLLKKTNWNIYCIDKFSWVRKQLDFARRTIPADVIESRFHIIEQDFLTEKFEDNFFDIVTNISVIEHFESDTDSLAMAKSARLLKPGGIYLLTTLMNEGNFREFYIEKSVYGEAFDNNRKVYYQRHYDTRAVEERLLKPSGLKEVRRTYFGDYGYRFFERVLQLPAALKPLKIFFSWAVPHFARTFLTYSLEPISYPDMKINTSSGVILTLSK